MTLRGREQARELVAIEGVGARDVEHARQVEPGQLEEGAGQVADVGRAAHLVAEEDRGRVRGHALLRARFGAAVEQRGPNDQGFGVRRPHRLLGVGLRPPVVVDRPRLVVFCVGALALAVEDDVSREVEQPGATAVRGPRHRDGAVEVVARSSWR